MRLSIGRILTFPSTLHRANGIILIYDITNEQSFHSVNTWLQEVNRYLGHKTEVKKLLIGILLPPCHTPRFLSQKTRRKPAGNKADLEHDRQVRTEQAKVRPATV
jgi:GTPase SAR1 family protein